MENDRLPKSQIQHPISRHTFELDEREIDLDVSPLYPSFDKKAHPLRNLICEKPFKQCNICHIIVILFLLLLLIIIKKKDDKHPECALGNANVKDMGVQESAGSRLIDQPICKESVKTPISPFKKFEMNKDYRGVPRSVESGGSVIVTRDSICSQMGAKILKDGGNAVDAMVTSALCIGVVAPYASGIGGGAFILIHMNNGTSAAIDARGYAGENCTKNMFETWGPYGSFVGGHAITVPLELLGLEMAWKLYGSRNKTWGELLDPVINLARTGFKAPPEFVSKYENKDIFGLLHSFQETRQTFLINNGASFRSPKVLELCCDRNILANTLIKARDGVEDLYKGKWGKKLVNDILNSTFSGLLTHNDIANAKVLVKNVSRDTIFGMEVIYLPPPSSAAVIVTALKFLESYGLTKDNSTDFINNHRMIESLKHAFAIRTHLGDTGENNEFNDLTELLDEIKTDEFIQSLRDITSDEKPSDQNIYGGKYNITSSVVLDSGTSHISIVDKDRNAVSMTSSINEVFGSFVLSETSGVLLNDEMNDFTKPNEGDSQNSSNYIKRGKKPLSSMSPMIFLKDGEVKLVIGGTGTYYVIPSIVQVLYNIFITEMDPFSAVKKTRIYALLIPKDIFYESYSLGNVDFNVDNDIIEYLNNKKHTMKNSAGRASVDLIMVSDDKTKLIGVADPRVDGASVSVE